MEVSKSSTQKDRLFFFDKKSVAGPINEYAFEILKKIEAREDEIPGVLFPNGEINWGCPCLGTAPIGPCSKFFRAAFTCFHKSTAEMKGSDCLEDFENLQECMKKFPKLYNR